MALPEDIRPGDTGHADLHNRVNAAVNGILDRLANMGGAVGGDGARGLIGRVRAAANEVSPVLRVIYEAAANAPDLFVVSYDPTNADPNGTDDKRWTFWLNERGLLRGQSSLAAPWDVLVRWFGPADGAGFRSNIIEIRRNRVDGAPNVFVLDRTGRIATSLYPWVDIATGEGFYGYPDRHRPAVRKVSDDTFLLRGTFGAPGSLAVGQVLGRLPDNHHPTAIVPLALVNATGAVSGIELMPNGDIVCRRAASSGVGWVGIDGHVYT